jgi:hypothetical protein
MVSSCKSAARGSAKRRALCAALAAGPMEEAICAENNADPFGVAPIPVPHADKPDF